MCSRDLGECARMRDARAAGRAAARQRETAEMCRMVGGGVEEPRPNPARLAAQRTLRDARSDRDAMPVAFYHEEGAAWPRGELPAEVASFAACAVDLFAAAPWVLKFAESLRDPASERRANLTKWLPRGLGEASAAAFLARKVAALDHAVARTPDGRSVVWLDVDCVLVKKPDGTFLGFLKTVDVATIARVPVRRERPATGVVALTGGCSLLRHNWLHGRRQGGARKSRSNVHISLIFRDLIYSTSSANHEQRCGSA